MRRGGKLLGVGADALNDDGDVALPAREQGRKQMDGFDRAGLRVRRDADSALQRSREVTASLSILIQSPLSNV